MKISELPEEVKELALQRQKEGKLDKKTDCLGEAFSWIDTKEGLVFWHTWYLKRNKYAEFSIK